MGVPCRPEDGLRPLWIGSAAPRWRLALNTIRTRLVSHLLTSITLMVAMVAAAPAFAQAPKPPLARPAAPASKGPDPAALVRSAEAKTKSGDLAGALADYQAADAVKPTSELAFAVGDTQDKLGKLREAVVSYERFLASVPARMKVKGEEVQKRVAEIKGMPGKLHIDTSPPGAVVLVDSKPQPGKTPTDVDLPSGKHVLRVELEGHQPAEKEVAVDYAGKQDLSFELQKPPPPPPRLLLRASCPRTSRAASRSSRPGSARGSASPRSRRRATSRRRRPPTSPTAARTRLWSPTCASAWRSPSA